MSSFIRHRQRAVTAVSPHQGNRKVLVPKRIKGYRALSWSTIPGFVFYEGVPANVDFRAWLSGTNRATATITEGDTFPTGFSFLNGVLAWTGIGDAPNTVENQMTASDGEGPDADSNLFNIQVQAYTALVWSGPVIWEPSQNGSPSQLDIRAELSGTNAATAQIGGLIAAQMPSPQILPDGYSWDGSILTYDGVSSQDVDSGLTASDGVGPDANTPITVTPVLDVSLVSAQWAINNKNGTLDSRDPDYAGALPGQISVASSVTFSDGGQVQIAVTRSGGADGIVGASWQITGPNAADFSPNNGTVSFADGETIGNITTTIADIVGGGLATLTLSSPTGGATLGNASLAITVSDASYGFTPEAGFSLAAGTIGDNEVITIADAQNRFGTKPNGGPPLHLWDAEYGDTDWSSLARNTQSHTDPIATLQTSVLPPNAVRAFQYDLRYGGSLSFVFGKLVWGNSPIINVAMRFRSNFRGPDYTFANAKGFRNPTNDGSSSSVPNWTGPDLGSATSGFSTGTIYHGESKFGMAQFDNTWRTLHFFGRLSSSSLERVEVDGVREDYPGNIGNRSGAYFQDTNMLTEQAGDDWTPKISGAAWWASYIYGDDSHCVAYLTDQANYSTTAEQERALCIPVSWVNGELQVRLRKRTYSDLSGLYLFAQTNDYTILKLGRIT